ncbi:hypothetical protein ZWY2020_007417 [Hordeum vulgare]|nr:hypothetical protein ZWY2020_007417 [Hordeum vulgare]
MTASASLPNGDHGLPPSSSSGFVALMTDPDIFSSVPRCSVAIRDDGSAAEAWRRRGQELQKVLHLPLKEMPFEEDRGDDEAEAGRRNPPTDGGEGTSVAALPLPVATNTPTTKLWFDRYDLGVVDAC